MIQTMTVTDTIMTVMALTMTVTETMTTAMAQAMTVTDTLTTAMTQTMTVTDTLTTAIDRKTWYLSGIPGGYHSWVPFCDPFLPVECHHPL
jgi:hypothetical protein